MIRAKMVDRILETTTAPQLQVAMLVSHAKTIDFRNVDKKQSIHDSLFSLRSIILDYRKENGRTYHRVSDGSKFVLIVSSGKCLLRPSDRVLSS